MQPGQSYLQALIIYNHSKNILSGNGFELKRLIAELEEGKLSNTIGFQQFRKQLHEFQGHLLRYLHNYASAYMTFVSHTRVMMRSSIIRSEHRTRYEERIKTTLANEPITRFMQDLRNYVLHHELPYMSYVTNIDSDENSYFIIELDKMQEWEGWTRLSRNYILTHLPSVKLLSLIEEHERLMVSFNAWFISDYHKEYEAEINSFELQIAQNPASQFFDSSETTRPSSNKTNV